MNKEEIENIKITDEKILNDPEGFIDKYDFSVFDEKARKAMDLAREIEQDSLNMMEKGFSMAQQIYEAELATNDHLTGLAKFFISLSSTALFAAVGLNVVDVQSYLLYALAGPVLITAVIFLIILIKRRNKIIRRRSDDYQKINDSMEMVASASKLRVKALKSVAEDDPAKMQEMFKELGFTLNINPVDLKRDMKK